MWVVCYSILFFNGTLSALRFPYESGHVRAGRREVKIARRTQNDWRDNFGIEAAPYMVWFHCLHPFSVEGYGKRFSAIIALEITIWLQTSGSGKCECQSSNGVRHSFVQKVNGIALFVLSGDMCVCVCGVAYGTNWWVKSSRNYLLLHFHSHIHSMRCIFVYL